MAMFMNIDSSTFIDDLFTTVIDLDYTESNYTPCYFMPPPLPNEPVKFNDTQTLKNIVKKNLNKKRR